MESSPFSRFHVTCWCQAVIIESAGPWPFSRQVPCDFGTWFVYLRLGKTIFPFPLPLADSFQFSPSGRERAVPSFAILQEGVSFFPALFSRWRLGSRIPVPFTSHDPKILAFRLSAGIPKKIIYRRGDLRHSSGFFFFIVDGYLCPLARPTDGDFLKVFLRSLFRELK